MISGSGGRRVFIVCSLLLASFQTAAVVAEQNKTNFKVGDRVEVKQFDQWKPGKVVSIDKQFGGRLEVRLDESDLPANFPKEMREHARTKNVDPSEVRRAARPAPKAAAANANPLRKWTDRSNKFNIECGSKALMATT